MATLLGLSLSKCVKGPSTTGWCQGPARAPKVQHMFSQLGDGFRAGYTFRRVKALRKQVITSSYDEEFRDSRSIALGLHKRYKDVVKGGFSNNNLKEFIHAGVAAYEVGCTDEGMRKELLSITFSERSDEESGGAAIGVKQKLATEEVEECILWLTLVFLTILVSPPPTVVRWSNTPAVSPEGQIQWRGFCALIANAYYTRGMAWLPVKTLQLEQMAVSGYSEEPSLVADRMRIVFDTLEIICPQWPKR
ncbi:hypothetical protein R1sor_019244 [Riccia sorocarpa]|uniref:DUF7876 domain-containing protein n=1 Tax=Riccia sorocarpa TaxID=122646 RepID=A0ABD3IC44_9MARC